MSKVEDDPEFDDKIWQALLALGAVPIKLPDDFDSELLKSPCLLQEYHDRKDKEEQQSPS